MLQFQLQRVDFKQRRREGQYLSEVSTPLALWPLMPSTTTLYVEEANCFNFFLGSTNLLNVVVVVVVVVAVFVS